MANYLNLDVSKELPQLSIELGGVYLVVASTLGPFLPWYFIDGRNGLLYPNKYPSNLFKVIDNRPSQYWETGSCRNHLGESNILYAPEPWAYDDYFHGKLVEGDVGALQLYEDMRFKLSLEYSLPWIKKKAVSLSEGKWVADESYSESWEVDATTEMIVDPFSKELIHNPFKALLQNQKK